MCNNIKNNYLKHFCLIVILLLVPHLTSGQEGTVPRLTLSKAISIALENNPELEAARRALKAREGDLLQARLLPNPELSIEVENFGGAGDLGGFRGAETTFQISQLIETGGKRWKRGKVANLEIKAAELEYHLRALSLSTQVEQAFWEALSAQKKYELTNKLLGLAKKTLETAKNRVEAGKVSPIELNKARVMYSSAKIELRNTFHQLRSARKRLSSLLAYKLPEEFLLEGDLEEVPHPESISVLEEYLKKSPRMRMGDMVVEINRAKAQLVRSLAIPDITVSAGIRHFEETDDRAFLASIEIPLPIFDRKQGARLSAQEEVLRAVSSARSTKIELKNRLYAAYHTLRGAIEEVEALKKDALPQAEKSFSAAEEGYRYGKFSYLDLLDAQRTLFELKLRYIDALLACHTNWATLKDIIGGHTISKGEDKE